MTKERALWKQAREAFEILASVLREIQALPEEERSDFLYRLWSCAGASLNKLDRFFELQEIPEDEEEA